MADKNEAAEVDMFHVSQLENCQRWSNLAGNQTIVSFVTGYDIIYGKSVNSESKERDPFFISPSEHIVSPELLIIYYTSCNSIITARPSLGQTTSRSLWCCENENASKKSCLVARNWLIPHSNKRYGNACV